MSVIGRTLITAGAVGTLALAGYFWKDAEPGQTVNFAQLDEEQPALISIEPLGRQAGKTPAPGLLVDSPQGPNTQLAAYAGDTALPSVSAGLSPFSADRKNSEDPSSDQSRAAGSASRMTKAVARLAAGSPAEIVEVIVGYNAPVSTQAKLPGSLDAEIVAGYANLPFRVLRLPAGSLSQLAESNGVRVIDVDAPVRAAALTLQGSDFSGSFTAPTRSPTLSPAYAPKVYQPVQWPTSRDYSVAVVDSGVSLHPDVSLRASISCLSSPAALLSSHGSFGNHLSSGCQSSTPDDLFGHGTHIAGVVGGSGAASSGVYRGQAEGSSIVSLQVLDSEGKGSTSICRWVRSLRRALSWIRWCWQLKLSGTLASL